MLFFTLLHLNIYVFIFKYLFLNYLLLSQLYLPSIYLLNIQITLLCFYYKRRAIFLSLKDKTRINYLSSAFKPFNKESLNIYPTVF
jgi:hypothetical protein